MKFNSTLLALSVAALFATSAANAAITGTSSVKLTVQSTITAGTCTAKVTNSAGADTTVVNFGDVFKPDIANKSRVEPLKISFSGCSGVKKATVSAAAGTGGSCSGTNKDGSSYAAGQNTAFEIWSGAVDSGVELACKTPPAAQTVNITSGAGEFPMNSRIVVAKDKTISDVGTGSVTAPVTFTVTYQ
ncbi:TPA: fimbrial protein [Enterobacter chengduensis]|uniref:Fimbrial protein n=1 Tax=Enterobacter chengduensis TaxID=2494701 RepID=A0AAW3HMH5_9ENTR|nr:fimbrial protein [Enterobacter chengduensis]KDF41385.1 hypothetical protein AE07_03870 [Enterobacter cloacae BWH 43]OTW36341.1 fimbrial protein [Enterobacter kobei]GJL41233.1 fimbrial protein [Enterobacter asburiae]KJX39152.1 fimbrial protein [Enterobacter chengduensis]MBN9877707.1 fimbrial protein [Enterobacter chengduensis]